MCRTRKMRRWGKSFSAMRSRPRCSRCRLSSAPLKWLRCLPGLIARGKISDPHSQSSIQKLWQSWESFSLIRWIRKCTTRALQQAEEINQRLLERNEQLESEGYHAQVKVTPSHTLCFYFHDGVRLPV